MSQVLSFDVSGEPEPVCERLLVRWRALGRVEELGAAAYRLVSLEGEVCLLRRDGQSVLLEGDLSDRMIAWFEQAAEAEGAPLSLDDEPLVSPDETESGPGLGSLLKVFGVAGALVLFAMMPLLLLVLPLLFLIQLFRLRRQAARGSERGL